MSMPSTSEPGSVVLHHAEADYTDRYFTDTVVPQVGDHAPIRVTRATVRIEHLTDRPSSDDVHVTIKLTGELIMYRHGLYMPAGGGDVMVFGLGQERTRYELCRAAIKDALERHQIPEEKVHGFAFLQPWAEYTQTSNWNAVNLAGSPSKYVLREGGKDVEDDRF